jgi:NADPH:quinone reductase-like Zn-dependent oxidoreductase
VKAVVLDGWGKAPVVRDAQEPPSTPGRALMRLRAAALNPVDVAIASGKFYGPTPEPPFVLGAEAVGEVVRSDRFASGTRVWCLTTTGGFVEYLDAPEESLVPVPDGISDEQAAAIGIAGLAGWMSVLERGELDAGETVVVLGASGVVGQVAIQAARARGAGRIIAAARTKEGLERALALGAHWFVPLDEGDVARELRDASAPGADLIIDMVWGTPVLAALEAARSRCRLIQVGNAAGATSTITGGTLRGRRLDIRGFSVFAEHQADLARSYGELAAEVAAGSVTLRVESLPLVEAPIAWARQISGTAGRKLVLVA